MCAEPDWILTSRSLPTSTIIAIVVAFVVGISGIVTTSFCFIRTRRRRRRREEFARRIAAEAKKEYDEKLPRNGGAIRTDFAQGADFTSSAAMSPSSPFGDEQRVRYEAAIDVVDQSADTASINMENGRAMLMGRDRRSRSRHGDRPTRARTLNPRRSDVPVVRELDSDRASARGQVIRTLPIREGDITPYALPPMSTTRATPVLNLTIPSNTYQPSRPIPSGNWRRTSDEDTVNTLATDDFDVLAEDGSSLARTLTTESGESGTFPATHGMFRSQHGHEDTFRSESPVAWGPGPFGDEWQSSGMGMAQQTDFDDASTIAEDEGVAPSAPLSGSGLTQTPTLLTANSSSSGSNPIPGTYDSTLNPFADPSSNALSRPRFPRPPQSDAGRSESSTGARTEASFRPGDDARSDVLNLSSRWRGARGTSTVRNGINVTYLEDLDSEDDQTTPSDTVRRLAPPPNPRLSTGDSMSATDEDDYIRTLEGALTGGRKRTEERQDATQLPPSYDEVFGTF